jgi:hypothetical protein
MPLDSAETGRQTGSQTGRSATSDPGRSKFVVVYATLAVLLFLFPHQISDRLSDFPPNAVLDVLNAVLGKIAAVSDLLGFSAAFDAARKLALAALTGGN